MRKFALAILLLGAVPQVVPGAAIDTLTSTPLGANTAFAVTGTFPADFPTTSYSAPNTPYALTFTVPTAPTTFALNLPIGVFVLDTSVTLNRVTYPNSQAAFFTPDLGGGVDVCVNDLCSPDPTTVSPRFVVFTNPIQLFSGTLENPVFISGPVSVDPSQSVIESPVPEPASFSLGFLGCGIVSMALFRKRRWGALSVEAE